VADSEGMEKGLKKKALCADNRGRQGRQRGENHEDRKYRENSSFYETGPCTSRAICSGSGSGWHDERERTVVMRHDDMDTAVRDAIRAIERYRVLCPTDRAPVARALERARIDLQYLLCAIDVDQQEVEK